MKEHPITPPPELVREWQIKIEYCSKRADREATVAKIFQLGADQELDACCEWLSKNYGIPSSQLRAARRPKPPSLKEKASQIVDRLIEGDCLNDDDAITLRQAVESLPS